MEIDNIKNPELKKHVLEAIQYASSTIRDDLHDALECSSTDDELIANWQSALMDLHIEAQEYWGDLEKLKS